MLDFGLQMCRSELVQKTKFCRNFQSNTNDLILNHLIQSKLFTI
jgi:hypothetical protein